MRVGEGEETWLFKGNESKAADEWGGRWLSNAAIE